MGMPTSLMPLSMMSQAMTPVVTNAAASAVCAAPRRRFRSRLMPSTSRSTNSATNSAIWAANMMMLAAEVWMSMSTPPWTNAQTNPTAMTAAMVRTAVLLRMHSTP